MINGGKSVIIVVAKLDSVTSRAKRFLSKSYNYESIAPQIEANYQPIPKNDKNASVNANFEAKIEGMKTIHAI